MNRAQASTDGAPIARLGLWVGGKRCYHMPVRRLLSFLMVVILVVANGSSVAGAVCSHESPAEHQAARQSDDARISSVAFSEDAANAVASKKGAIADAAAIIWIAALSRSPQLTIPFGFLPLGPDRGLVRTLVGRSIAPLLEPPAA